MRSVSPETSERLARGLARAYYRVAPERRRTTLENLRVAFGASLTEEAREDLARRTFEHAFVLATEVMWRSRLAPGAHALRRNGVVRGDEAEAREDLRAGRGAVCLTGHLGNWELAGAFLRSERVPFAAVARPLPNPFVDAHLARLRGGARADHREARGRARRRRGGARGARGSRARRPERGAPRGVRPVLRAPREHVPASPRRSRRATASPSTSRRRIRRGGASATSSASTATQPARGADPARGRAAHPRGLPRPPRGVGPRGPRAVPLAPPPLEDAPARRDSRARTSPPTPPHHRAASAPSTPADARHAPSEAGGGDEAAIVRTRRRSGRAEGAPAILGGTLAAPDPLPPFDLSRFRDEAPRRTGAQGRDGALRQAHRARRDAPPTFLASLPDFLGATALRALAAAIAARDARAAARRLGAGRARREGGARAAPARPPRARARRRAS